MSELVDADADAGVVSREIFVDPGIYREELESLFTRAWLFIGHESQIPRAGDFITSRMGDESVILVRDEAGEIHVLLNSCRHRGMKVCRYESGNTSVFTCPYHSWSYATDGTLRGVPQFKSLYEGVLDRDRWSLIEVAKLENYKGTIWATWDPQAPDFLTYLGDARIHLDQALDCRDGRPGGSEVIGVHKWVFPANWKFAAENFLGDTYHNPSHRSVDLIGIGPSARAGVKGRRDDELDRAQHVWISFAAGHGVHSAVHPEHRETIDAFMNDAEIETAVFPPLPRGEKPPARRPCTADAVRGHLVSEHFLPRPPATTGCVPGIPTARPRPRPGDSSSSMPTRRRGSRSFCGTSTCATPGRPA